MIDYKYPTIASGATPIGSVGCAPDEELLWEERGRKFWVHCWWQAPENKLDIYSHRERGLCIDNIIQEPDDFGHCIWSQRLKKLKIWSLETQHESATRVESRGLLTWICPSGTHGLVCRVQPIKDVDKYKDSKIDLETKKEGSNPYSTTTLVKPSLVVYIKPGRGALEGQHTTQISDIEHTR
jgi:hypothetical protein